MTQQILIDLKGEIDSNKIILEDFNITLTSIDSSSRHSKSMRKYWLKWHIRNSVRLYFLGTKITADGDCSHEIKTCLFLGRKVVTNLGSILKIRDIAFPTKVCLVNALVFPVVMCVCESWSIKKAEHWRIDVFELWCWRRLLRSIGLQGDPVSPF